MTKKKTETVRAMAKRLGVSISRVRKFSQRTITYQQLVEKKEREVKNWVGSESPCRTLRRQP